MANDMDHRQFWDDKATADDAAVAASREYSASRDGMLRRMQAIDAGDPRNAGKIAGLEAAIAAIDATDLVSAEAEWTRETTIARRTEWNTAITAAVASRQYKSNGAAAYAVRQSLGYDAESIKAAIARHGL